MAIRGDSYGTVAEVLAYTRHVLGGESTFSENTNPTLSEVEDFIDRASGVLNNAVIGAGLSHSSLRANSTAKLACDDWVILRAVEQVELTRGGTGHDGRQEAVASMYDEAAMFVAGYRQSWVRASITEDHRTSEGLGFSGLDVRSERTDPDDSTREQPKFRRGLFDT